MPYAHREAKARWQRAYEEHQARLFASGAYDVADDSPVPDVPEDAVGAFVGWAQGNLRVPTGPLASKPFVIPSWQESFLRAGSGAGIVEAGLSVARKNGKSGLIAAWLLAHVAGPLLRPGWRAVVVSLTGNLAKELKDAMEQTAIASGIEKVSFLKTPPPGRVLGPHETRIDFLAADRATGHAVGADLAVIDEAGLMPESQRPLWNAVLSCTSGRNGRLMAISIRGDGPMFGEIADRANDPGVHWTEYAAREDCSYDDVTEWHKANPGLADGIKSVRYMEHMSRRAMVNPKDAPSFAAYDLNQPQEPSRELILTPAQWLECVCEELPERDGPVAVGIDLGGSASMTAYVAYWPLTGRLEALGAFPSIPDLRIRGEGDGVGGLYKRMFEREELIMTEGRVVDVALFVDRLASDIAGEKVIALGCDRYRKQEFMESIAKAGVLSWPLVFRGQGHSATADGSTDVRSFQRAVLEGHVKTKRSLVMEAAIANSAIARDASGNPKLDKAKASGRIDALQAGVISIGIGMRWLAKHRRGGVYKGAA